MAVTRSNREKYEYAKAIVDAATTAETTLKSARADAAKERKNADDLAATAVKSKTDADAKTPRDPTLDQAMYDDAAKAKAAADKATQLEADVNKQQADLKKLQDDAKKAQQEIDKVIAQQRARARHGDDIARLLQKIADKWEHMDKPEDKTPRAGGASISLAGDMPVPDGTFKKPLKLAPRREETVFSLKDGVATFHYGDINRFMSGSMDQLIAQGCTKLTFNFEAGSSQLTLHSRDHIESFLNKLEKRAQKFGVTGEFPPDLIKALKTDTPSWSGEKGLEYIKRLERINEAALAKQQTLANPAEALKDLNTTVNNIQAKTLPPSTPIALPIAAAAAAGATPPPLGPDDFKPKIDELQQKVQAVESRIAELLATKKQLEAYYSEVAKVEAKGDLKAHFYDHDARFNDRKAALDLIDKEVTQLNQHETQIKYDIDKLSRGLAALPAGTDKTTQEDRIKAIDATVKGLPLSQIQAAETKKLRVTDNEISDKATLATGKRI